MTTPTGFMVLLHFMLQKKFATDQLLKDKNWLFTLPGNKIIVHGPNRQALGDTEIIAEVSTNSDSGEIFISLKAKGTVPDRELLAKVISEIAENANINFCIKER